MCTYRRRVAVLKISGNVLDLLHHEKTFDNAINWAPLVRNGTHSRPLLRRYCYLMDWGIIECRGAKAKELLHGQSTADIRHLESNYAIIAAFCLPNGKTYTTGIVYQYTQDVMHVLCDVSLVSIFVTQMEKYLPFFRCQLKPTPAQLTYTIETESATHKTYGLFNITQGDDGYTIAFDELRLNCTLGVVNDNVASTAWQKAWLQKGYAMLTSENNNSLTPNMLNFDQHAGVSFTKGCYNGQEIVARTYYRGQVKRRLRLATTSSTEVIVPNTPIQREGNSVGYWLDVVSLDGYQHGQVILPTALSSAETAACEPIALSAPQYAALQKS